MSQQHHPQKQQQRVDPYQLIRLQKKQLNIRNICILAHIDHGKTTLSDSLISSNGIISDKLVGKLRYLDSTEEEQKRGITMHSSAISLYYNSSNNIASNSSSINSSTTSSTTTINNDNNNTTSATSSTNTVSDEYLINLIDSPGHIDFSSDVSTAIRLCDGGLIIIDVLEGICTQTHAVIYKALKEGITPCLVFNKIDRLYLEMMLTTTEAFYHLRRLLEQVNALCYTLLNSEIIKRNELHMESSNSCMIDYHSDRNNSNKTSTINSSSSSQQSSSSSASTSSSTTTEEDPLFQIWSFDPDKGNLVFACAFDCWGLTTTKFANIYAKKYNVNMKILKKYFFDDYVFNLSTKKITKYDPTKNLSSSTTAACNGGVVSSDDDYENYKPMFARFILDPIWHIYDVAINKQDAKATAAYAQSEVRYACAAVLCCADVLSSQ